jgi:hypothetical protein
MRCTIQLQIVTLAGFVDLSVIHTDFISKISSEPTTQGFREELAELSKACISHSMSSEI